MVANLSIDKISAGAQALPELEGPLVVAQRVAEGIHALGCHARFDHRRHRTRPVAGSIPVIGELRRRWRVRACIANPRRERPREGSVQPRPLPRQQLRVHDFLEQRVVKRVAHLSARSAHRHQDLVVDHLTRCRLKCRVVVMLVRPMVDGFAIPQCSRALPATRRPRHGGFVQRAGGEHLGVFIPHESDDPCERTGRAPAVVRSWPFSLQGH